MARHYLDVDLAPLCDDWSCPPGESYVLTPVLDEVDCHACYDAASVGIATVEAARRWARIRRVLRWWSPLPRLVVVVPDAL